VVKVIAHDATNWTHLWWEMLNAATINKEIRQHWMYRQHDVLMI
jgi:hypothetical protein